ncbi:hypothetical protein SAMD00019534_022820 [Acytostelium subglobosum LB1]|uniref:hypothetical protein n=1 Tax=Acytostelium subglobosum LB1 TaxID=1410327 RepID=UPI000644C136|nr:hypothetical protein SAMD00019534_022820 [Acytostelium subglobosum LB1]GAM19107.1 hypothetical protein SAMD00019534_022820 [Acytostelium subglobosum LB1]|eukprot:XP_012757034.1 hypothetical protein SAMD00019534_022820 [Acytostelium subglobosum LB1]
MSSFNLFKDKDKEKTAQSQASTSATTMTHDSTMTRKEKDKIEKKEKKEKEKIDKKLLKREQSKPILNRLFNTKTGTLNGSPSINGSSGSMGDLVITPPRADLSIVQDSDNYAIDGNPTTPSQANAQSQTHALSSATASLSPPPTTTYINNTYKLVSSLTPPESDNNSNSSTTTAYDSFTTTQPTSVSSISTSSSVSSLRSNSNNSIIQHDAPAMAPPNGNGSSNSSSNGSRNHTLTRPTKKTPAVDDDAKKKGSESPKNNTLRSKSSRIKMIYNSLRSTLRGTDRGHASGELSHSQGLVKSSSQIQFEFAIPSAPQAFEPQYPSLIQYTYSMNPPASNEPTTYFGLPLARLVRRQDNGTSIPVLVEKSISFLEGYANVEGLFKTRGDSNKVQALQRTFDTSGDANFWHPEPQDPHVISTLLIEFLSSIPDELLSIKLFEEVNNKSASVTSQYGGFWDIQYVVSRLPVENRELVQRLLFFLKFVVDQSSDQAACLDFLVEKFTPLVINFKSHQVLHAAMKTLITHCEDIFIEREERPQTLAGEFTVLRIERVLIPPNNLRIVEKPLDLGGWETGTLYVTNYRMIWVKTEDENSRYTLPEDFVDKVDEQATHIKPYQFEIVLSSSIKWEAMGKAKATIKATSGGNTGGNNTGNNSGNNNNNKPTQQTTLVYLIFCKDMRFQYFGFPEDFEISKLNLMLGYYISPMSDNGRFFATVNHEVLKDNQEGWDIYSPLKECTRLKIDVTKEWRVIHFTAKDSIAPKHFAIPNRVGEDLLATYAKKRMPVFCWVHPYKRSLLFRVSASNGSAISLSASGGFANSISLTSSNNSNSSSGATGGGLGSGLSASTSEDIPHSPLKKRSEKTFSPLTKSKSSSSTSRTLKKDLSYSKLTPPLLDTVDIMLYQQFVNKEYIEQANGTSASNNSPVLTGSGQRRIEAAIVFTNKTESSYVNLYDQYKFSHLIFVNVTQREETETHWYDLYRAVHMFDGTTEAWRSIEESGWVESVRSLIEASTRVCTLLEEGTSVMIKPIADSNQQALDVARLSSLAQVMLDPYFRTISGFMTLIEKEWIQFNYNFLNSNGQQQGGGGGGGGLSSSTSSTSLSSKKGYGSISKSFSAEDKMMVDLFDSISKRSPLMFAENYDSCSTINRAISPCFIQFIDAVWQMQLQFPFHFEFNESLLLFIINEAFTGRFGTFLWSETLRETERNIYQRAPSIWTSQIILWSSLFTANITSRDSMHQLTRKLIGKSKVDMAATKMTFFKVQPSHLVLCTSLTSIDLSRNYLNSFPTDLVLFRSLQSINLSDNRIKSIPSSLFKLIGSKLKLLELNLAGNLLDSVHKSICSIGTLQRLNLDNNRLVILPESLSKISSLRTLSVSNNRLSSFPQALSLMVGLEVLYVSNNHIRDLPLGFFKLRSLKTLHINSNLIAKFKPHKLDDKVFMMNAIETLRCGLNPLIKISAMLFEMKQLRFLELTGCNLSTLPPRLLDLVNLETLLLNQNKLAEIPAEFARLTQLSFLDLSDNQFSTLPAFALLPTLRKLYLHNNSIYSFTFNNNALPVIEELRLDGNRLSYVSPSIGKLASLETLNLGRNPNIQALPHTIACLERLKTLTVQTANMVSPLREMDNNTEAIMRYLKQQSTTSYYSPRGKLVFISDQTIAMKNEIIRAITTNNGGAGWNGKRRNKQTIEQQKKVPKWEIELPDDSGFSSSTSASSTNTKRKGTMTIYVRDIFNSLSGCSQHLFTRRAVYTLLWTVQEAEEPTKLYRSLELIKDHCVTANVFVIGMYNEKENLFNRVAKVEKTCLSMFTHFTFSFHLVSSTSNVTATTDTIVKLREDIKATFLKQRQYGSKLTSSQRLFERHLKTLQSPFISKRDIHAIGEMCGLDKIGTKSACDLLTELGLLLWLDDYEWVILDTIWLTTTFSSLITVKSTTSSSSSASSSAEASKREIILMSNLDSIWNDVPGRLYSFLLSLAKKFNIAFIIDTLYDPSTWGYTYQSSLGALGAGSQLRLSVTAGSRNSTGGKSVLSPTKNGMLSPNRLSKNYGSGNNNNNNNNNVVGDLKVLKEKVIFLPMELPDAPPKPLNEMFPNEEPRAMGRIFVFATKIPSSFFHRLLSQLYMFCSIKCAWKTGVVLDNCYLSFPIARRYCDSPKKAYRRSSTFSVLTSDDLVVIQVHEASHTIEISSTKMCRHILQTFESILETYPDIQYKTFVPCTQCINSPRTHETNHLFPLDVVENAVIKGKTYLSCPHDLNTPIKLHALVPDLTMGDLRHKLIDFNEVQIEPEPIGEGGNSTVYRGTWRNNTVAVKILQTDNIGSSFTKIFAEFRREIFIMSSFYHPNILDLKGFCLEPLCIITQYMSGGNLYDYVHDLAKPLDWPLKIKMAKEIAGSLQTLHDCKPAVIHRDLKSPNILLSTSSDDPSQITCHLCDFSVSGFSTSLSSRAVENPVWLAPEVITKESCTDKSDVYSFGVILYELLSRQDFFEGISFMSNLEQMICDGIRPQLPKHSVPEYDILLQACWNQDPTQRPSFQDILKRLDYIETIIEMNKPELPITNKNNSIIGVSGSNNSVTVAATAIPKVTTPPITISQHKVLTNNGSPSITTTTTTSTTTINISPEIVVKVESDTDDASSSGSCNETDIHL